MTDVPVLILAYNRPYQVRRLLAALRSVRPRKIYLSIDGPANEATAVLGRQCAAALDEIDWECQVAVQRLGNNHGGSVGPSKGISWMFSREEFGIIFDDDIDPRPEFFEYVAHCRDEFRHDARVGAISGNNFTNARYDFWGGKCGLSRYFFGWGWATWRERWNAFNLNADSLEAFVRSPDAIKSMVYGDVRVAEIWQRIYERWRTGGAWDFMWQIHLWKHGLETLIPPVNLTGNVGIGADSTNIQTELMFMADWRASWLHPLPANWRQGAVKSVVGDQFNNTIRNDGVPESRLFMQTQDQARSLFEIR